MSGYSDDSYETIGRIGTLRRPSPQGAKYATNLLNTKLFSAPFLKKKDLNIEGSHYYLYKIQTCGCGYISKSHVFAS